MALRLEQLQLVLRLEQLQLALRLEQLQLVLRLEQLQLAVRPEQLQLALRPERPVLPSERPGRRPKTLQRASWPPRQQWSRTIPIAA